MTQSEITERLKALAQILLGLNRNMDQVLIGKIKKDIDKMLDLL